MSNPFRYFNSSPEVIRLVVMMYVRYPLSLRNVEDLLAERGIDIETSPVSPALANASLADFQRSSANCCRIVAPRRRLLTVSLTLDACHS